MTQLPRIFKIGTTTLVEDETMTGRSIDAIKQLLQAAYPEVAHATVRETTLAETGQTVIHFIAKPGRKG